MVEFKENKQGSKKISDEEFWAQLFYIFRPYSRDPSQDAINTIISQLSGPVLDLSSVSSITEKRKLALRMIAKALEDNKICKELSAGGVSKEGLHILIDMLKINTSIVTLDLSTGFGRNTLVIRVCKI